MAQRVLNRSFDKTFALDLLQKDIGIAGRVDSARVIAASKYALDSAAICFN